MSRGPGRTVAQPGRRDAQGEGQASAQLRDLGQNQIVGRDARRSGHGMQQRERVGRRQHVQRERVRVVEAFEASAAGDQHQTSGAGGQQRTDLGFAGGVVQHDQSAGAGQALAVERGALLDVVRDALRRYVQRAQQRLQRVAGCAWFVALGVGHAGR